MDVLASGPERPPRTGRPLVRTPRRGPPRDRLPRPGVATFRRRAGAAVGVVLAVGVAAVLRATAEPIEPRRAGQPAGQLDAEQGLAAPPSEPPFDRLPGRTPIPEPTLAARGEALRGVLPTVGPLGERAAYASARLVIGRYCRRPARYAVTVSPERGWHDVRALAVRLDRSSDPPWVVLELTWTGRAYTWTGPTVQLYGC